MSKKLYTIGQNEEVALADDISTINTTVTSEVNKLTSRVDSCFTAVDLGDGVYRLTPVPSMDV